MLKPINLFKPFKLLERLELLKLFEPLVVVRVWAIPLPLVATQGISVDFFSSGY